MDGSFDRSTNGKDDGLKDGHNIGWEEVSIEAFIEGVLDRIKGWSADGFVHGLDNGSTLNVGLFDLN